MGLLEIRRSLQITGWVVLLIMIADQFWFDKANSTNVSFIMFVIVVLCFINAEIVRLTELRLSELEDLLHQHLISSGEQKI